MMLGVTPLINDLAQALAMPNPPERPARPGVYRISPQLLDMFRKDAHQNRSDADEMAYELFENAQRLYQSVRDGNHSFAVFYKLEEKNRFVQHYLTISTNVKNDFVDFFQKLPPPSTFSHVVDFFSNGIREMQNKTPQTSDDKIREKILNELLRLNPIPLKTDKEENIHHWFGNQRDAITKLAYQDFYKVRAYDVYTIYSPGLNHNWGVNAAWVLAIMQKGLPIHIRSPLSIDNIERTSRPSATGGDPVHPSAFALEIAIAVKMGYQLTFNPQGATLQPPHPLRAYPLTNGVLGNGILPTKAQQFDIFRACILEQFNHEGRLQNHVQTVCKNGNITDKTHLINGLRSLVEIHNDTFLLQQLNIENHRHLRTVLTTPPFNDNRYNLLINKAKECRINTIREELDRVLNTSDTLHIYIHEICQGNNQAEQQDLMDALAQNPLKQNILNALTSQEKMALDTLLAGPTFTSEDYDVLKAALSPSTIVASSSTPPPILPSYENLRSKNENKRTGNPLDKNEENISAKKKKGGGLHN